VTVRRRVRRRARRRTRRQDALTCAEEIVTVSLAETDVTGRRSSAYHRLVRYRTEQLLTKRRAVDFCRVTTALCRMA